MTKKGKVTRKQLLGEPDEFITFSSKLLRSVIKYKIQISCILGATALLIAVVSGVWYFSDKAENRAFAMLNQVTVKYETIMKESGPHKAHLGVKEDFQLIFEKYSRTDGGRFAKIIYANICYNAGDFERAIVWYNKALQNFAGNRPFKDLILSALGYSHEMRGDYKTAIRYFNMIASEHDSIIKDEALFNLGRLYAAVGDKERSTDAFKRIILDHPDSIYSNFAIERVGPLREGSST